MNKTTLFPIYIVLLSSFFCSSAFASSYDLSISPPLLRVHIKPGKSISQVFKIDNQSQTDKTLIASILPFTEADTYGNPILNPKANAPWLSYFSLANSSLSLDKPFTLKAGASEQLILGITIPENAPLKDIYATLIVSTYTNTLDTNLSGTQVSATIGSNILITISSSQYPDTVLRIEDFKPKTGSFLHIGNLYLADSISSLTFSAVVNNQGSFAAETKGIFRVTSNSKPVYMEGVLPVNVIGKSRRQVVNTNGELFKFDPSLTQIGLHQISLDIKTDNSNTTSNLEIFFFPFKLGLGLLIISTLIITTVKITAKPSTNTLDNTKTR